MLRLGLGLFLISLPLLELALLVGVAHQIGFWATFAAVLGSGFIGALVISRQSMMVMRQVLEAAHTGQQPAEAVLSSAFAMTAGVLFMVPGFISDGLALILLVPPIRQALGGWLWRRLLQEAGAVQREDDAPSNARRPSGAGPASRPSYYTPEERRHGTGQIIDGEFERLDEKTPTQPPRENPRRE